MHIVTVDFLFQLDGTNLRLAKGELMAILESASHSGIIEKWTIAREDRGLVLVPTTLRNVSLFADYLNRAALIKSAGIVIGYYDAAQNKAVVKDNINKEILNEIKSKALKVEVRYWTFGLGPDDVRTITHEEFMVVVDAVTSLSNKSFTFSVKYHDAILLCYLGALNNPIAYEIFRLEPKLFENRSVKNRPFFMPTSIHPKLARSMANISHVDSNARVLDPFCGTGGILIECALLGAEVYGIDIDPKIVQGCITNLNTFCPNWKGKIVPGKFEDAITLFPWRFDAIITDFPYGRSTHITHKIASELYFEFLQILPRILRPNGTCVVVSPEDLSLMIGSMYGIEVKATYVIRVHRSLNRYIYVLTIGHG